MKPEVQDELENLIAEADIENDGDQITRQEELKIAYELGRRHQRELDSPLHCGIIAIEKLMLEEKAAREVA